MDTNNVQDKSAGKDSLYDDIMDLAYMRKERRKTGRMSMGVTEL